jgi:hypothetical protein
MAAISQKISTLIGGVSQQPDSVKFNGQVRSCDNYYPDVAVGLTKRPGLQGIRKLDNPATDGTWFVVFRDDEEKYLMQFSKAGALKVWSANTGLEQTVNTVAAESVNYATHTNSYDLDILQINDYVFVLNRTKTVSMSATTSASINPYAFVNINTVAYSSTYSIKLNNTEFSYATTVTAGAQLNVKDIIDNLVSTINANTDWVATGIANTIHIRRADNANFSIQARGGTAGTAIEAYQGSVTAPAQLPKQFIDGLKIKVSGSNDTGADDYWVIFKTNNGATSGAGVWEETIAPNTVTNINEETLPHVIIREADGTFTYRKLDEASAIASAGSSSVTGIPTQVSILTATSGGHTVNESFSVTGGAGENLRLLVTKIKTITTVNSYIATSNYYVTLKSGDYKWYENNVYLGKTGGASLTIGNKRYTVNGSFTVIGGINRAGITITATVTGAIDTISIQQAGQGYNALDTVTSTSGDTFRVDTVNTANLEGDAVRLNFWKPRQVGDEETNPNPSFIGYPIDAIGFFKNRLIFTSRQNVICSQAGDYFNFFADTVITIVDSDPIDLSASTLRPVRFTTVLGSPRGLLMFGDNAQYILETTTEAFAPKTAEVNILANFSATDRISPVDLGTTYVFLEEGQRASSIFEMDLGGASSGKSNIVELTRFLPTYIPTGISKIKASNAAGLLAIHSSSQPDYLYLYRWFQNGDQGTFSSWFRWNLPGDIETFDFDEGTMYIVTKKDSNYVLSTMSLVTDTPSQSLYFDGAYLDARLDLFDYNPTLFYDLDSDTTRVCFKEGFENMDEQAVIMYLDPTEAGYFEEQTIQYDASKAAGEQYYLVVPGNKLTSKFALGYKYTASTILPAFYFVRDVSSASKDTVNIPRLSRIKVNSYSSGPFKVKTRVEGRDEFELTCPQIFANNYLANKLPLIRNAQSTIPIMARGDQVEVEIVADNPFPIHFTSIDWEGTYDNKGIQSL